MVLPLRCTNIEKKFSIFREASEKHTNIFNYTKLNLLIFLYFNIIFTETTYRLAGVERSRSEA